MYFYIVSICMFVSGIPAMVPGVTVDNSTININGNIVTLTLSWGEPFNNFDPIVNYTVSCSGDDACPPSFTTTDNTTRSYTITNLTTMTTYTLSVVATNSVGSGEAGTMDCTTPYKVIIATSDSMAPSQNIIATIQSVGMINTSSESTTNATSSLGMTTTTSSLGMTTTTSSVDMTTTTSSVGMNTTITPNEDMTTIPTSEGKTTSYFISLYAYVLML